MQGAGPPGGHNPFGGPGANPFNAYQVDTTAQFADEVVPAVPQQPAGPPGGAFAPQGAWGGAGAAGAWGGSPQQPAQGSFGPQHVNLQFTDTTAQQYVSGTMGRGEERQNLVHHGAGSTDPGASSSVPGGMPFPQQQQQPYSAGDGAPSGGMPGAGGERGHREDYTKYPFYNVRRYREYFDVDTTDVLWRVGNSMIGVFRPNFMEVTMKNPDLYGPFWAATTLIFITAVAGNFVSWLAWRKNNSISPPPPPILPSPSPSNLSPSPSPALADSAGSELANVGRLLLSKMAQDQWFTDYTKLATSAAIFYGYIFIVGLIVWGVVKWFRGELKLVNVFCIYGYCLTVYVPVSIACVVPINWLQWLLVMLATALGAGFLFMNFKNTIYSAAPAKAVPVLLAIVLAHIALGLGLKLYFFQY
ncbi:hypothetical protein CHLRE_17g722700v5 [Chlamydomonas reinhardtii]|uniref:Yip1 domain-containing protein n=1 Tax=Chlamydomonas reinhardtii TaxID=3055 RepID=A0A2K3CQE6_CHLRE|nr:uncharacterized protein CHLRE_17g722700v5 [Chlamydomonas reinhardtii]PNW70507.1 hypothetical protein CHLRE_17g722700v5 [Chlamydomonas reinhardtii]